VCLSSYFLDIIRMAAQGIEMIQLRRRGTFTPSFSYVGMGPMRRRLIRIAVILLLFPPLLAGVAGWLVGPGDLPSLCRELTPDLIREADSSLAVTGSTREDFEVRAQDGALLRGWKVRPKNPN